MTEKTIVPFPSMDTAVAEIVRFAKENRLAPADVMHIFIKGSVATQAESGVLFEPVVVHKGFAVASDPIRFWRETEKVRA